MPNWLSDPHAILGTATAVLSLISTTALAVTSYVAKRRLDAAIEKQMENYIVLDDPDVDEEGLVEVTELLLGLDEDDQARKRALFNRGEHRQLELDLDRIDRIHLEHLRTRSESPFMSRMAERVAKVKLPPLNRCLDLVGLILPEKTRDRIFTPYAEELKEDDLRARKKFRTPGARRFNKVCSWGKFFLLLASCAGNILTGWLGRSAKKVFGEALCAFFVGLIRSISR
jgi:hypothetical protein